MKNNNILKMVFFLFIFTIGACTDLEENPIGLLAPESFFKTTSDAEAAVMGAYTFMAAEKYFGRKYTLAVNLLDDACDIGDIGTDENRVNMNSLQPDASNGLISSFWPQIYGAIGAANSAINGIESITSTTNEAKMSQLLAEARIIRAYCYYNLVRLFGDIPYVGEFVNDPNTVSDISKTSAEDVYEYIIADCEFAVDNLPDTYSGDIRCRPTAGAAKTMLASVYLTLGDYAKAVRYAEDVINNAATYEYELLDNFTDLWIVDNGDTKEHIWTVDFMAGETNDIWATHTRVRNSDQKGWSTVVPSPGLYDIYEDGDQRIDATFLLETEVKGVMTPYTEWTWPRPHFAKYALHLSDKALTNGRKSGRNYPIFRFSEVYLIAAEALTETNSGPTAKAYEYINIVRERARNGGEKPADLQTGLSKEEFINAVLDERLREFPLEYKRWFDIKRRQIGNKVFAGENSLEPHNFDASKNYLLPLPQDELDRNQNLLPQNPGY